MRFLQFTSVHTGHPVHIREDLIAGWTVEHEKTLLLLQGYDIDIEVKETPEQVLRIIKGESPESSLTIKDTRDIICGERRKRKWDYLKKQERSGNSQTGPLNQQNFTQGGTPCVGDATIKTLSYTDTTAEKESESVKSGGKRTFRSKSGLSPTGGEKILHSTE